MKPSAQTAVSQRGQTARYIKFRCGCAASAVRVLATIDLLSRPTIATSLTQGRNVDGQGAQDPLLFQLMNEIGILAQLSQNRATRLLAPELNMSQFIVLNHFVRLGSEALLSSLARTLGGHHGRHDQHREPPDGEALPRGPAGSKRWSRQARRAHASRPRGAQSCGQSPGPGPGPTGRDLVGPRIARRPAHPAQGPSLVRPELLLAAQPELVRSVLQVVHRTSGWADLVSRSGAFSTLGGGGGWVFSISTCASRGGSGGGAARSGGVTGSQGITSATAAQMTSTLRRMRLKRVSSSALTDQGSAGMRNSTAAAARGRLA
ncbi:MAG: hypothetical protein ACK5RP_15540 [Betaproteobacteria bacterium]